MGRPGGIGSRRRRVADLSRARARGGGDRMAGRPHLTEEHAAFVAFIIGVLALLVFLGFVSADS